MFALQSLQSRSTRNPEHLLSVRDWRRGPTVEDSVLGLSGEAGRANKMSNSTRAELGNGHRVS